MVEKKSISLVKPENISTETNADNLIYDKKLFLSWKRNLKKWSSSKGEEWNVVSLDGGKYNIPEDSVGISVGLCG